MDARADGVDRRESRPVLGGRAVACGGNTAGVGLARTHLLVGRGGPRLKAALRQSWRGVSKLEGELAKPLGGWCPRRRSPRKVNGLERRRATPSMGPIRLQPVCGLKVHFSIALELQTPHRQWQRESWPCLPCANLPPSTAFHALVLCSAAMYAVSGPLCGCCLQWHFCGVEALLPGTLKYPHSPGRKSSSRVSHCLVDGCFARPDGVGTAFTNGHAASEQRRWPEALSRKM